MLGIDWMEDIKCERSALTF